MNLADDLRILRNLRIPQKYVVIQFVADLFIDHPQAMMSITDPKELKDLIYSNIPVEEIAKELERPLNERLPVEQILNKEGEELWRQDTKNVVPNARRSSKPTDSRSTYPRSNRPRAGR